MVVIKGDQYNNNMKEIGHNNDYGVCFAAADSLRLHLS